MGDKLPLLLEWFHHLGMIALFGFRIATLVNPVARNAWRHLPKLCQMVFDLGILLVTAQDIFG